MATTGMSSLFATSTRSWIGSARLPTMSRCEYGWDWKPAGLQSGTRGTRSGIGWLHCWLHGDPAPRSPLQAWPTVRVNTPRRLLEQHPEPVRGRPLQRRRRARERSPRGLVLRPDRIGSFVGGARGGVPVPVAVPAGWTDRRAGDPAALLQRARRHAFAATARPLGLPLR